MEYFNCKIEAKGIILIEESFFTGSQMDACNNNENAHGTERRGREMCTTYKDPVGVVLP